MGYAITSKGQVTIPKQVRESLGVEPGDEVAFHMDDQGRVTLEKVGPERRESRFAAVRGAWAGRMTTDEIMALTRGEDD